MAHYVTIAPTGLAVTRNGAKFTFTWKIGDKDYGRGQQISYGVLTSDSDYWQGPESVVFDKADRFVDTTFGETGKSIDAKATSKTITLDLTQLYPAKQRYLKALRFWVRGQRSDFTENKISYTGKGDYPSLSPSNWAAIEWKPTIPNDPKSLTASLINQNRTKFAWDMNADAAMKQWMVKYEYQSILLKNSTITDGAKVYFNPNDRDYITYTGTAFTGERYVDEDYATDDPGWLTTNTYTRWFRIRGRGVAGNSKNWRYAKHIYAQPLKATNLSGKLTLETASMLFYVKWKLDTPVNRPVDSVMVQYIVGPPSSCTASGGIVPPSGDWTDNPVGETKDTKNTDGTTFRVLSLPSLDDCVWARVVSKHDNVPNTSDPLLMKVMGLTPPTNLTVEVNSGSHMATVSADNGVDQGYSNSVIIVRYYEKGSTKYSAGFDIAKIEHGASEVTFQCPNWGSHTIYFGVYAAAPKSITTTPLKDVAGCHTLKVDAYAKSTMVMQGGTIPTIPKNVVLSTTDIPGTINVKWQWENIITWETVEISWADHEDAWESTNGPSTYTLSRLVTPSWNISGLNTDSEWFVRLRFGDTSSEGSTVWGDYTQAQSIDLALPPEAPALHLSAGVITVNQTVKASWTYYSENGSPQQSADIYRYQLQNNTPVYTLLYHLTSEQSQTINPKALNWTTGNTYQLALRVTSSGGKVSEYSNPVSLSIADPITINIVEDSLERDVEVVADEEKGETRTITALTELPLTVRVTGAGYDGTTGISITRTDNYYSNRPDEDEFTGYEGESVVVISRTGEEEITIENEDLVGHLDDGAHYRLTATVADRYGQTATDSIDFEVHWSHQAMMPEAQVVIDENYEVAMLSPIAPDGALSTDVCDIYRLSADKPELVYESARFGQIYVDKYPTIGEHGGYRFVFKTANGDYITEDNKMAWIDVPTNYNRIYQIIDFGNQNVNLMYNVDLSNSWSKDFKETKYLGGSIQGDWNSAISRTASISGVVVTATDQETIRGMRRLAMYPGVCRIRTIDGSNYEANIQVGESRGHEATDLVTNFTLNATRVDTENPAGLSYEEWAAFIENTIRVLSVSQTVGDETVVYSIRYTAYSSSTQVFFRALSITASGSITGYTSDISFLVDDTEEYSGTDISGDIPLSVSKTCDMTSEEQSVQLKLVSTIDNGEASSEEIRYAYVSVPVLEE